MGGVLTYLTQTQITSSDPQITGKVLSRPALLATDGSALIYVVDVDIGNGQILRNVPIPRNNRDLVFADAGNAVTLQRTANGFYQIIGLSPEMPGTYTVFEVDLEEYSFGEATDLTLKSRVLTLGELSVYGTFGQIPFGAIGIFQGGTLLEITL